MPHTSRFFTPLMSVLTTGALTLAMLVTGSTQAAVASPGPVVEPANAVTADRLPTVQVDGVVWSQAVVGNTVYAGGSFTSARPAGAAPGTNLTTAATCSPTTSRRATS